MAEKKNRFLEASNKSKNRFLEGVDPSSVPDAIKTVPIDSDMRIIIQNIFDTQPAKRKAFLEQLGWEMNDKDENLIRPMGSQIDWKEAEKIDPGYMDAYKKGAAGKHFSDGMLAVAKEGGQDIGDIMADTIAGIAATKGALQGSALGAPGGPWASLALGITGGALGEGLAESSKQLVADQILSKEIPTDKSLVAIQSLFGGLFNAAGFIPGMRNAQRKGQAYVKEYIADGLAKSRKTMEGFIRKAGGASEEFLERYAQNPDVYDEKVAKGVEGGLRDTFRNLFGLDPEKATVTKVPKKIQYNSKFGEKLRPLNDEADLEIARVMRDPDSKITYGDYIQQLNPEMGPIVEKLKSGEMRLTQGESDALTAFNKEIKELGEAAGITQKQVIKGYKDKSLGGGKTTSVAETAMTDLSPEEIVKQISEKPMSFGTLENNIDVLQDKTFVKDPITGFASELPDVAMAAGRLRRYRDEISNRSFQKAQESGEMVKRPLSDIKAEQSKILDAYNNAIQLGTPDKILKAYGPQVSGVAQDTTAKQDVRAALKSVDEVLGTNLEKDAIDGTFQKSIDDMHRNYAQGSSNVQAAQAELASDMAKKEAAKFAAIGGVAGLPGGYTGTAMGGGLGTAIGGAKGYLEGKALGSRLATPGGALGAVSENALEERLLRGQAAALREAGGAPISGDIASNLPLIGGAIESTPIPQLLNALENPVANTVTGAIQRQSLTPFMDRLVMPKDEEERKKNRFLDQ